MEKRQLQGRAPGKQDFSLGHQFPFFHLSPPKVLTKPQQWVTEAGKSGSSLMSEEPIS